MEDEVYYGTVLITKGKYKGTIGYYDDDEGPNLAIVYLGAPFASKYVMVRPSSIVNTEIKSLALEKWIKENPSLASIAGINS